MMTKSGEQKVGSYCPIWGMTLTESSDVIMPKILPGAQAAVASYQKKEQGAPDPSFVLHLPNEVYSGSNLFALQKLFDGKFQFDIFFESGSVKQKLDCMFPVFL